MKYILIITAFLSFESKTTGQASCQEFLLGTFQYEDNSEVGLEIFTDRIIENYKNGEVIALIDWKSDCNYIARIEEVNVPDFPYPIGTSISVFIDDIDGNRATIIVNLEGEQWRNVLIKG